MAWEGGHSGTELIPTAKTAYGVQVVNGED